MFYNVPLSILRIINDYLGFIVWVSVGMSITNDTPMPSDEELAVPQEITLSTPWLKAVGPYMARHCEDQIKVCFVSNSWKLMRICLIAGIHATSHRIGGSS